MAQEVITRLVDDIDGGEADQTVVFSWGSAQYEIDHNDKNADKMAKALQPYLDTARKVSRGTTTSRCSRRWPSMTAARPRGERNVPVKPVTCSSTVRGSR